MIKPLLILNITVAWICSIIVILEPEVRLRYKIGTLNVPIINILIGTYMYSILSNHLQVGVNMNRMFIVVWIITASMIITLISTMGFFEYLPKNYIKLRMCRDILFSTYGILSTIYACVVIELVMKG